MPVPPVRPRWRLAPLAGTGFAGALAGVALTLLVVGGPVPRTGRAVTEAVLDSHIRSLMPDHLTDVLTSDQHTVKPWLSARLDVSPNVTDFVAEGFPLVGGREDYIDGHPAAAVVYRHAKHVINLFAWAAPGCRRCAVPARDAAGVQFDLAGGTAGIEYVAVSDVEMDELAAFTRLVAGKRLTARGRWFESATLPSAQPGPFAGWAGVGCMCIKPRILCARPDYPGPGPVDRARHECHPDSDNRPPATGVCIVTSNFLTLQDLVLAAHERLGKDVWDFVTFGTESETTIRRNRRALDSLAWLPRILRDVSAVDASTTLLHQALRIPVLLSPIGSIARLDPLGRAGDDARGGAFGTLQFLSSHAAEEIARFAPAHRCR